MYTLDLFDSCGWESYSKIIEKNIHDCDAFIIVFSVTDQSSFINVRDFYYVNIKNKLPCPIVLVGNKIDLSVKREIEKEEAEQLARQLNMDEYIETSATSMPPVNIEETFHKIVYNLIKDHHHHSHNRHHLPTIKSNKKTTSSNNHKMNCYGGNIKKCSVM